MKKITEMNPAEFRELLYTLVSEELFKSRERLAALLGKNSPQEALEAEFFHFHGDTEDLGFWFEEYEQDPLKGLDLQTPLGKKLKRQREYILANRKTTLEERIYRRMGVYLKSDPMPDKKIIELSPDEFRELLQILVTQDIFPSRERLAALLEQNAPIEQLDAAFREFFVAYELLELALEDYYYDPDEELEMQPEFAEELDRRIADYETGRTKPVPMEKIFKKLGIE
ncbi:MAG: addiction module protein [Candidatus Poribacteria bacterium]|nr:addiction module protein [Candidatus Poribacteria bacterium]